MGIESWEHITEAIENGTENIKVQNMNNSEQQGWRTGLWLPQTKHIRGHLWHKYSQRLTNPGHGDVCKTVEVVTST
jgi:hypothetical protein